MEPGHSQWLSLAVALGCGLLIGIERERRKGSGSSRAQAGVRTFSIAALAGALAQSLEQPLLVAAGALFVISLSVVHYARTRARDPGVTTELALLVTFLLGATAAHDPALAGGAAAVVAILLAARSRLHRFATEALSESELRDGLILAGAALVVLPLMPDRPIAWLAMTNPRTLWRLMVLLLALQALGYLALRALGARVGLALSGLAAGFVSSTATFAAMGAQARAAPDLARACAGGALFSNVATVAQLALVTATVSAPTLASLWPVLLATGLAAAAGALVTAFRASAGDPKSPPPSRMFDLQRSAAFVALLGGLTAALAWTADRFGASAALAGATLAGFVDVHASVASVSAMVERASLSPAQAGLPILCAFTANTASKLAAAWFSGGGGFALRVLPGLAGLLVALWGSWLLF
jgi:uncharacterized membrane protein (DUF4010 family)